MYVPKITQPVIYMVVYATWLNVGCGKTKFGMNDFSSEYVYRYVTENKNAKEQLLDTQECDKMESYL